MAKMSDFSNHNIFAYMLASCANLNFHPVLLVLSIILNNGYNTSMKSSAISLLSYKSTTLRDPVGRVVCRNTN